MKNKQNSLGTTKYFKTTKKGNRERDNKNKGNIT